LRRPRPRIAALAAATGVVVLALGTFLSWRFSSAVVVPDHSPWSEEVSIEAVGPHRITFERSETSLRPGVYGLTWPHGHAVVGPVLQVGETSVQRRLGDVRGRLTAHTEAGFESNVYSGAPGGARGLPFDEVPIRGELGRMPAWLIPARSRTWVIVVHGINDDREVGLRIAPVLHRLGLPSLLITYRDDVGAPSSPDGHHHMGLTEWRDLQAAARYALSRGAGRLVLVGYSMGGAIVTQFAERSPLAGRVSAIVLDAPVLDWKATIEFNATQMGLPGFLALPVEWAVGARIDADWQSLKAVDHGDDFRLPVLLFHGEEDEIVPIETSEDFAESLPRRVVFYRLPRAGHTQSWNVDPDLYERRLRRFLLRVTPETGSVRPTKKGRPEGRP
jgi:pimeloyl-ACP methyl ester carboxylesterase